MATICAHHVRNACVGAARLGHSPEELLMHCGINPQLIALPNARVNDTQMAHLIQLVWKTLGDEFMGFTESVCKPGAFSFMVHTIARCKTLREALTTGTSFYNLLTNDIRTELVETGDQAAIVIEFRRPELDSEHFFEEFWMVIWHRLASWLCGIRIPLLETTFSQPNSAHAQELKFMFPGEHRFDGAANRMVFSQQQLNASLVRRKLAIEKFLILSPYNLMSIPGYDRSLHSRIVKLINADSKAHLIFPSLEELAARLNMSQQTLHRHLKKEARSYQKIKDNMRRDLALTKLIREKRPVYEVAEAVGFSDARTFTRAFKHWTGMTPREYCRFS